MALPTNTAVSQASDAQASAASMLTEPEPEFEPTAAGSVVTVASEAENQTYLAGVLVTMFGRTTMPAITLSIRIWGQIRVSTLTSRQVQRQQMATQT